MREVAEYFTSLALGKLIEIGRIKVDDVHQKWYVKINSDKLDGQNFAAGATIDNEGRAVIYFHPKLNLEGMMHVAAHESVHLAQICCGDMVPLRDGRTIWRGKEYGFLEAEHSKYAEQPWEAEAFALEDSILEYIKSKAPPLPGKGNA